MLVIGMEGSRDLSALLPTFHVNSSIGFFLAKPRTWIGQIKGHRRY